MSSCPRQSGSGLRDILGRDDASGIGTTKATLSPHDFCFDVHNVRVDRRFRKSVPVQLARGGKWQLDDAAPLAFEDATGGCVNGPATW